MDGMMNHMMPSGFPVSHTHSTTSVTELLLRVQDERNQPEGSTMNVAFVSINIIFLLRSFT